MRVRGIHPVAGLLIAVSALVSPGARSGEGAPEPSAPPLAIPEARVPADGLLTGGQPTREQLVRAAELGYRVVIDLRPAGEAGRLAGEETIVTGLGMRYVHIPIAGAQDLTEANARRLDEALRRAAGEPVLFHCASGNRVGALLALEAALVDGVAPEEALALGKRAGLTRLEEATRRILGLAPASPHP